MSRRPIDRRWWFLLMLLAVTVPFLIPLPGGRTIQPETAQFYERVGELMPDDGPVLFSLDYSPDTAPEVEPLAEAAVRHCLSLGVRVMLFTAVEDNQGQAETLVRRLLALEGVRYGEDLLFLGFRPEIRPLILSMAEELRANFPVDYLGTPLDDYPLGRSVRRLEDFSLVVSTASDDLCLDWITFAASRFGTPLVMAVSANLYATVKPYKDSGEVQALLRGMAGAAEYERLLLEAGVLSAPGDGSRGMGSQTAAHLLLIALIVLGNARSLRRRAEPVP